ncbi:MAG TPA: hypothetical protein VJL89_13510 [Thermodesulfovibrionia bacterium]|nr:hypothetical protein [Thermodesulfovibrionia bacterium]
MGYFTERGKMCIEVFGLNIRDRLPEERKKVSEQVKFKVIQLILNPAEKEQVINDLARYKKGEHEYSAAARTALNEIKNVMLPVLET